jgi:hypothetical protein
MPDSKRVRERRDVSGFSRVTLGGVGDLVIRQGDSEGLEVEADEQVLRRIVTRVEDRTLFIDLDPGVWWRRLTDATKKIRYDLTMREMAGIALSGIGTIQASGVSSERLQLVVSGAGRLRVTDLSARDLTAVISGAGSCEVSGRVETQDLQVTGAGSFKAPDLRSSRTKALLSGTGGITVNVDQTLDATISGAGSIKYHGEPTVFQRITGVGSVRSLDCASG